MTMLTHITFILAVLMPGVTHSAADPADAVPAPRHDLRASTTVPEPVPEPWASLAECESHGEWGYNENSGWGSGLYDGGLQFDPATWLAFGGGEHAPTADRATPAQQVAVAQRVLAAQGWNAWPACSRKLGLR